MQEDRQKESERIGTLIRQMRGKRGWTQKDLAQQANMNQVHICHIERGKVLPRPDTIKKFAVIFDLPLNTLLSQDQIKNSDSFGQIVRTARKERRLSQKDVSEKVGVGIQHIGLYERGKQMPRRKETVVRLADALGIDQKRLVAAWHPSQRLATERLDGDFMECTRCQQKKPLSQFHKDKQGPNGFQTRCKVCREEMRQTKRGWNHVVADGLLKGKHARILNPPPKTYKPHPDDYPDPVWTIFEGVSAQWFPRGRLRP